MDGSNTKMENSLKFRACIFDFDGILVNSEIILVKLWVKAADECGYSFQEELFNNCLGRTWQDIKKIQIDHFGKDYPFDTVYKKVQEYFKQEINKNGLPLVPGVLDVRQFLEDSHIDMAVASSTFRDEVLYRMKRAGLDHLFNTMLGGDDIKNPKPAPDIFLKAAEALQASPADCLVIEDSESGVLAAKAAGMKVVMVQNLSPITDTMRENANGIFHSHAELLQFLKKNSSLAVGN